MCIQHAIFLLRDVEHKLFTCCFNAFRKRTAFAFFHFLYLVPERNPLFEPFKHYLTVNCKFLGSAVRFCLLYILGYPLAYTYSCFCFISI